MVFSKVVEERLTYVNTHAKLVAKQSHDILNKVDESTTAQDACNKVVEQLVLHSRSMIADKSEHFSDLRLSSFVTYLVYNDCHQSLLNMAVMEQLCLPGLENTGMRASKVISVAQQQLEAMRKNQPGVDGDLKNWHQAYHNFRLSAHCFVKGTEAFAHDKFDEAVEFLTVAYALNTKIQENPPIVILYIIIY